MLRRRTERRSAARPEHATLRIVDFRVGDELYGLEISGVREIDRMQPVTRVPQALPFVEGVNHRLRHRARSPATNPATPSTR